MRLINKNISVDKSTEEYLVSGIRFYRVKTKKKLDWIMKTDKKTTYVTGTILKELEEARKNIKL